jgi:Zn-dependent protease
MSRPTAQAKQQPVARNLLNSIPRHDSDTADRSMTLFRMRGIPLRVDPSSMVVFVVIAWTLAAGYFPAVLPDLGVVAAWGYGIASALTLLTSVVLHELAHALVARTRGVGVHAITLHVLGGASELDDEPPSPGAEAEIAIAGPLASGMIALSAFVARATVEPGGSAWAVLSYVVVANALLGVFNLVPAFPLDGGRVLRAILWAASGRLDAATRAASRVGTVVAVLMVVAGGVRAFGGDAVGGVWLVMIGFFIHHAARTSGQLATMRTRLDRFRVAELMAPASRETTVPTAADAVVGPRDSAWLAFLRLARNRTGHVPVVDGGTLVGVVDEAGLREAIARADERPHAA